jgi:hypothetical protein
MEQMERPGSDWDKADKASLSPSDIKADDERVSQLIIGGSIGIGAIVLVALIAGGINESRSSDHLTSSSNHSVSSSERPYECSSPDLISQAKSMLQNGKGLMGPIRVLKSYNVRSNPYYGKNEPSMTEYGMMSQTQMSASFFANRTNQCLLDMVTDHGEMTLSFGWKMIEGDTYILAQPLLGQ